MVLTKSSTTNSVLKKTLKKNKKITPQKKTLKKSKKVKSTKKTTSENKPKKRLTKQEKTQNNINLFKTSGGDYLKTLTEKNLSEMIIAANKKYYCNDSPLMTDGQYDLLKEYVEETYPNNKVVKEGHSSCDVAVDKKKVSFPYEIWSMDKKKNDKGG